jgi:phenylacetate-CoA ligase
LSLQVQFEISQWLGPDRILSFQLAQLRNVIAHAAKTTPYYKNQLEVALAQLKTNLSLTVFRQIPILTRSKFQDAGDSINSKAVPDSHGAILDVRTSGSTGQPLALKNTEVTRTYNSALSLRNSLWHRRDFSQKSLSFRTMRPGEAPRRSTWGPVINAGQSIRASMAQPTSILLNILRMEDPAYLVVHPSVLKELLYVSREQDYQPANLKEVRCMGEILYPELRERCQRQWNVRVTPCKPGEVGKTVISSLHNFATPMLRYENGDMAEVGEPCACGRGLPVLKRIIGRVRNTAILPNGERVMPNLSTGPLLNDLPIKHFQLVQKTTELIEARLVVGRPLTAAEETALANYFNKGWRHEFNFTFVYLDEIARGANGKYEVFSCEVTTE